MEEMAKNVSEGKNLQIEGEKKTPSQTILSGCVVYD